MTLCVYGWNLNSQIRTRFTSSIQTKGYDVLIMNGGSNDIKVCSAGDAVATMFDWEAPAELDRVIAGVDTLLVIPPSARHPLNTTTALIERGRAHRLAHVVFLSTYGAHLHPGFAFGRWAAATEAAIAASGVPHTILRPNSYMSNFSTMLRPAADGALRLPWGSGATSFIDPDDVAAAASIVIRDPHRHAEATYELTGPDALTGDQIAATLHQIGGAPIHYIDTPLKDVERGLHAAGLPAPLIEAFIELHAVMAAGLRSPVTDDIPRLLGRPARPFADYARTHARDWAPAEQLTR